MTMPAQLQAHPFGAVLKDIRASLNLSQAALALELGSTQRHLSFLETGRSTPTPSFLARICRELNLSVAQRANLYAASGAHSPYEQRALASADVTAALDMIEARVLNNWPFPALVLDASWNILRCNAPFLIVFAPFLKAAGAESNAPANLLSIMLSDAFSGLIQNWDEAVSILYFRLQSAAAKDPLIRELFADARRRGRFANLPDMLLSQQSVPVFVPVRLNMPDGTIVEMSSLLGKLASVQDALVDGFEIELMVPLTQASETRLLCATKPA